MLLMVTSGYSQSQTSLIDSNTVVKTYTASVQYPITRILEGDTVVILTLQQGKDMNRKFVLLRDSVKLQRKRNDSVLQVSEFFKDVAVDVLNKNSELTKTVSDYKDTIYRLVRKSELDKIHYEMGRSELEFKLELYKLDMQSRMELFKSEIQTKTALFNSQLESEKLRGQHNARHSAILSGLVVGGIAITGAMIISWMPSTWFK